MGGFWGLKIPREHRVPVPETNAILRPKTMITNEELLSQKRDLDEKIIVL
jgi:hypothetical protein